MVGGENGDSRRDRRRGKISFVCMSEKKKRL